MNCREFHVRLDEWALNALGPDQRAAMKAHLAEPGGHERCHEDTKEAMDAAALVPLMLEPVEPSRDLWPEIEASLGPQRPAPRAEARRPAARAEAPVRPPRRAARGRWSRVRWAAVAAGAAVAAAAAIGLLVLLLGRLAPVDDRDEAVVYDRGDPPPSSLRALEALRDAPGTRRVPLAPVDAAAAVAGGELFVSADGRRAFVAVRLRLAPGATLHSWVERPSGAPVHAGSLGALGTDFWGTPLDAAALFGSTAPVLLISRETAAAPTVPGVLLLRAEVSR